MEIIIIYFFVGFQNFVKVFKRHQKENEALLKRYAKVRDDQGHDTNIEY